MNNTAHEVVVRIRTGNDAFQPNPGPELARIFRELADKLDAGSGGFQVRLRDINGNTVGALSAYPNGFRGVLESTPEELARRFFID